MEWLQKTKEMPKGLAIMLFISMILIVIDLVTAAMNGNELLKYLETNPVFVATGSLIPVILLNGVFIIVFYIAYVRNKPFVRYFLINSFAWLCVARFYAIKSNLMVYFNPPTPVQMQTIIQNYDKMANIHQYSSAISGAVMQYIPFIIAVVVYFIFQIDHHISKKHHVGADQISS